MPPTSTRRAGIPPTLLDDGLRRMLLANRTPRAGGDLAACAGANVVGVERLAALAGAPFAEVVGYGERRMRAALGALPDGTWTCRDVLDSTGAAPDLQRPASAAVAVTVAGDEVTFDFTGTDPQSRGNVNAVSRRSPCSAVARCAALGGRSHYPRQRRRRARPVTVVAPPASLVAAWPPAAGAGNVEVSQRVADVPAGAGRAVPRPGARCGPGTMNTLLVGGAWWVYYETVAEGSGRPPRRWA